MGTLRSLGLLAAVGVAGACVAVDVTSRDYATDGLVGFWDGLDNTVQEGVRSHSAAPTVWADLSGHGNDVTLPMAGGLLTIESNAILSRAWTNKVAGVDKAVIETLNGLDTRAEAGPFTVECVMQRLDWRQDLANELGVINYDNLQHVFSTPRGSFGYRHADGDPGRGRGEFYFFLPMSESRLQLANWNPGPGLAARDVHTVAARFAGAVRGENGLSVDGSSFTLENSVEDTHMEDWATGFTFFGNPRADCRLFAVRVYNRELTEAELVRNHQLDRVRFLNLPPQLLSREKQIPSFIYQGEAITPDLTIYDPLTEKTLTKDVDYAITYANNVDPGTATLTVTGIGDYADYAELKRNFFIITPAGTSTGYTQNGLVLHLDGLDNKLENGVRSHDAAPTVWHDLSGMGNNVPLSDVLWRLSIEDSAILVGAYRDPNDKDKKIGSAVKLDTLNGVDCGPKAQSVVTVEYVMERGGWKYSDNYDNLQGVFSTPRGAVYYRKNVSADGGLWLMAAEVQNTVAGRRLAQWDANATVTAPHTFTAVLGWDWGHNAFGVDGGALSMSNIVKDIYRDDAFSNGFYFFDNVRADIRVYAIRVYNRQLTDLERRRHAALDRIRFFGEKHPFTLVETVQPAAVLTGTGVACTPDVAVVDTMTGERLERDVNYRIDYVRNDCIGVATATVVGLGTYAGYRLSTTFQIVPQQFFQPVEYIESTGTQWIDTKYFPNRNTKMELDVQFVGDPANRTAALPGSSPLGCGEDEGYVYFSMNFGGNATQDNKIFMWFNQSYGKGGDSSILTVEFSSARERQTRNLFTYDAKAGVVGYGDGQTKSGCPMKNSIHSVYPLALFGMVNPDGFPVPFNYYRMRVYGLKLWDGVTLRRDFRPCLRLSDSVVGLLDTVSGEFFTNRGTGNFGRGIFLPREGLPEGYRPLLGVLSDGDQWVDTGVTATSNTTTTVVFAPYFQTDDEVRQQRLFSARDTAVEQVGSDALFYEVYVNGNNAWACACTDGPYESTGTTDGMWSSSGVRATFNVLHCLTLNSYGNSFIVNGAEKVALSRTRGKTSPTTIRLLSGGGTSPNATGALEFAFIWEGDRLVRDFMPCYRESDGEAGLFDLVEEKFYPSDGPKPFLNGDWSEVGVSSFPGIYPQAGLTPSCIYANLTNFSFTAWIHNWDTPTDYEGENCAFGAILGQGALGGWAGFCCYMVHYYETETVEDHTTLNFQVRLDGNETVQSVNADGTRVRGDGQWHHVAGVYDYDNGVMRLYLDGEEVASRTADEQTPFIVPNYASNFALGTRYNGANRDFGGSGEMAQVTLWNRALTMNEINRTRRMPVEGTEDGLIAAWSLEDGEAGLVDRVSRGGVTPHNLTGLNYKAFKPGEKIRWFKMGSLLLVR